MREDFLAELDPYAAARPDPARARGSGWTCSPCDAALRGDPRPGRRRGATSPRRRRRLVDDLRRGAGPATRTGDRGRLGPYVEPVQLQVVCHRLWDQLPPAPRTIDRADVDAVGDVDRPWPTTTPTAWRPPPAGPGCASGRSGTGVERHLITPQGIRGQVLHGPSGAGAAATYRVLGSLDAPTCVRAESRRGATWYELAHDRLIEPVRDGQRRLAPAAPPACQRVARVVGPAGPGRTACCWRGAGARRRRATVGRDRPTGSDRASGSSSRRRRGQRKQDRVAATERDRAGGRRRAASSSGSWSAALRRSTVLPWWRWLRTRLAWRWTRSSIRRARAHPLWHRQLPDGGRARTGGWMSRSRQCSRPGAGLPWR